MSKGQAPSRFTGRVNLNIAGPVEVGRPSQYGRPRRGWQAAWEVGPIRGLVSGAAERQGAGRRFQREVCRAHPISSGSPGGLCVSPSAAAGGAEKADSTQATAELEVGRRGLGGPVERTSAVAGPFRFRG